MMPGNIIPPLNYLLMKLIDLLLYILNKKVVGSNNIIEQQSLNECSPPLAASGY